LLASDSFSHLILAHPGRVAGLLVLMTLLAAAGIVDPIRGLPRIRIDPSLNEMLPADDSARRFYDELIERFGSDDVVLVALQSSELFSPDGLATVVRATRALERAPGVQHVDGLATALRLRPVDDDVEISGSRRNGCVPSCSPIRFAPVPSCLTMAPQPPSS